ncbi:uncharacterized protein N7458_002496 [Penicillium daleae]|uniref:Uncharacterized protein n=1 Tax=Penicillium daleae TaxID=63821 RepID=A0AAD6G5Y0_9EURO|nr:uncharacterized protein N7458_002496 [Penicillium daleae]KAJ5460944.1 hypothetical protein N7458_002496 [Penicillium daleae]
MPSYIALIAAGLLAAGASALPSQSDDSCATVIPAHLPPLITPKFAPLPTPSCVISGKTIHSTQLEGCLIFNSTISNATVTGSTIVYSTVVNSTVLDSSASTVTFNSANLTAMDVQNSKISGSYLSLGDNNQSGELRDIKLSFLQLQE